MPCSSTVQSSMKHKSIPFANLSQGCRDIPIPTDCWTRIDEFFENQDDNVTIMDKTISSFIQNHQNGLIETIKSEKIPTSKSIPYYLQNSFCNRCTQPCATTCFPE